MATTFLDLIGNATSPDAVEAQSIILRRIALQGDVVPSRVPPPRNITEIGGYLNLLERLRELDMRSQVLAGILGVAGPNPPLGWLTSVTPLSIVSLANDRPDGPAQRMLPLTVTVRSDFAEALRAAVSHLHSYGCLLPMYAMPVGLPKSVAPGVTTLDPLPYLGRVLRMSSANALVDPTTDALVLARGTGSTGEYAVCCNAIGSGSDAIAPGAYEALRCDTSACTSVALSNARLVAVAPHLATAGFYPASPLPQPGSAMDQAWTRFTNTTGLVPGVTRLGDELALVYPWNVIAESIFSPVLGAVWDGAAFAVSP